MGGLKLLEESEQNGFEFWTYTLHREGKNPAGRRSESLLSFPWVYEISLRLFWKIHRYLTKPDRNNFQQHERFLKKREQVLY